MRISIAAALLLVTTSLAACSDEGAARATLPAGPNAIAITFTSAPGGASLSVDGVVVGNAPQTVRLNPGPHRVRATMSGFYPSDEARIQVGAEQPTSHTITLVPSH